MAEQITVTTEEIRKHKEDWLLIVVQMEEKRKEINELFESLRQSFLGKPVSGAVSKGIKEQENGRKLLDNLETHLEKLEEISRHYEEAERNNANDS